jgi:hypothetical protein
VNNYEKNYEHIRSWLADCDFAEAAPRLGLSPAIDGTIKLTALGREFSVNRDGVFQLCGEPSDVNLKSVIIWYLTYGGQGEPAVEFGSSSSFSGGMFGARSSDYNSYEWQKHAGLTLRQFRAVAKRIGAEFVRSERYGEVWRLFLFPKVTLLLEYSEADDEFPATIDIKASANALTFLPFETLAVAHGLIESEFNPKQAKVPLTILSCGIFQPELDLILPEIRSELDYADIEVTYLSPGLHSNPSKMKEKLTQSLERLKSSEVVALYGSMCHTELEAILGEYGVSFPCEKNCIEIMLSSDRKAEMDKLCNNIYLTAGWLKSWRDMGEMSLVGDKSIYLDCGQDLVTEEELLNFFDASNLEIEIENITLENLKTTVLQLLGG